MTGRPIETLLPHAGQMLLVEQVISYDSSRIVCSTHTHRAPDHPMAVDGLLASACGLEYGAQTIAIHGALTASHAAKPRMGYLVAVHDLAWTVPRLDTVEHSLIIEAERQFASDTMVSYSFTIHAQAQLIMSGRANIVLNIG